LCENGSCDPENCDGCLIDDQCFSDGAANPDNSCQVCDAPASDWENATDGKSCGENGSCDAGACACTDGWTGSDCTTCVVYVKTDGDDEESGLSWDGALADINIALELAASRRIDEELDTCQVWVAEGTYKPGTELTSTFELQEHVELYGGFVGNETALSQRDWEEHETILSGDLAGDDAVGDLTDAKSPLHRADNVYHVVTGAEDAALDGFTVRSGGNAEADEEETRRGAGLLNLGVAPKIKNCTFEDNYSRNDGAAVYTDQAAQLSAISKCLFQANVTRAGSTVFFDHADGEVEGSALRDNYNGGSTGSALTSTASKLSVRSSRFEANHGSQGAALSVEASAGTTISDSVFVGNVAKDTGEPEDSPRSRGGALYLDESTVVVSRCRFEENTASQWGGAITAANTSMVNVAISTFIHNSSESATQYGWGGAIINMWGASLSVSSSLFAENMGSSGGAITNRGDSHATEMTITNSTFVQNETDADSGIIETYNAQSTFNNCVFWDNSGDAIHDVGDAQETPPAIVTHSLIEGGYVGDGNLNVDPLFVDAADGDYALASNSPAIDEGDSALLSADIPDLDGDGNTTEPAPLDLVGNQRVVGESVDMGAYERP